MRALAASALALSALAAAAPAADAARYLPVFKGSTYQLVSKPKRIVFGAANEVSGIRWRGWDGSNARGTGRLTSTSGGSDISARVKVKAYRVRSCGGKKTYTRFVLTRVSGDAIGALSRPQPTPCPS